MSRWQQFEDNFGALPARQRVMIAIAAVLIIVLPMFSYVIMPDLENASALNTENQRLTQQIEQVNAAVEELKAEFDKDINEPLRQEIKQLRVSANDAQQSIERSEALQEVARR